MTVEGLIKQKSRTADGYEVFTLLTDVLVEKKYKLDHLWITSSKVYSWDIGTRIRFRGKVYIYERNLKLIKLGIGNIEKETKLMSNK